MPLIERPPGGGYEDDEPVEPANILIVDDLPEKLLVVQTVLEDLGQNLVMVHSGSEALKEVLKREFAVILLDVNMPDIDGLETARLIRGYKRSAHTPIIFITAYADELQTSKGYELGAVDYILSPVVPEVLRSKVRVFVELHNMQRRVRRQAEERVALAQAEALRRQAEENIRRSEFLSRASRLLNGSLDVDVGMRKLLELLVPRMGVAAAVQVMGRTVTCLADAAGAGLREGALEGRHQPLRDAVSEAVKSASRVQLPAPGRAVAVPLLVGDRVLGALGVQADHDEDDWSTLDELALHAAMAFENARLYRSLEAEIVERRQAETKLQASNRRKDEFLAMLSHELRNPLAPIRNAIEVIRRVGPSDTTLTWANDVMDRQVHHLTRLVEELLDVARISQGKIALQMEPVDLQAVVAQSVETVRPSIEARRHTFHQQLPGVPVWTRGDFARLVQIVANLLHNAVKYTEEGGVVRLSLTVQDGQAVIAVSDNGMGIEPELLPHVFDLFEQGKRSLDRSQGGLGVGLTLVQRVVEMHQGRVEADSAGAGQGAEFRVIVPCLVDVKAPEAAATVVDTRQADAGCRILVVDDNADAAESIAMFLRFEGHEVKTVGDGPQALASAPVYAPEVVVLDIGLPGMDGYEVAERLRQMPQTCDALLIAMTGYGQRNDQERALRVGFDNHLVKPADPRALVDLIDARRRQVRPTAQAPALKVLR